MIRFLSIIGLVLLVAACKDDGRGAERTTGTTQVDHVSDEIHAELMATALTKKIAHVNYTSDVKVGAKNPYNDPDQKYPLKALAMCLKWDAENLNVQSKGYQIRVGYDWGRVGFRAVKGCEERNLETLYDCKCQLVDRDNRNVLQVPADYRKAYGH